MPVAAPGRGRGADIHRERPASHGLDFSELHADPASSRPQSCSSCHARPECLSCHRPDASDLTPGYHPTGFLTTHPAAAYSRESSCADCHNQGQFCANCHLNAGLVPAGRRTISCLTCHSATGGRRFNPHGPGFDAATLRRKNPSMCTACHGAAIPNP